MVGYSLCWTHPGLHLFDIAVRFRAPIDAPRLQLPVWRPGRYILQNYAANVREWSASNAAGEELRIWKDGKSSWRVDAAAGQEVSVRYRFFAGLLDAGSSYLDEEEAYFNGTNLFMMVEGLRQEECSLTIAAPEGWRIETQLPLSDTNSFQARDFDHLADSPTVASPRMTRSTFQESGASIHLVLVNGEGIEGDGFVEPLRELVRAQAQMFGGLPISEYRFLVHVGDKWHGVEHESSCSIVARRNELLGAGPGDAAWDRFVSICSHEFFHVWNVKRILPSAFAPYDYSTEALTRMLWVMEGLTSYFGDLTLVRGGVWNEARYLRHLSEIIETLESTPGRAHVSLEQASFDSWLQNEVHDRANNLISFYNKGEIVGALLDLTILRATGGERSLEDVMRLLWSRYGESGEGMKEDAFLRAVGEVADVGDFFERYVAGVEPLPYAELLGTAGLEISVKPASPASLGAALRADGGRLIVAGALQGGAAAAAGLLPGDELIAIDEARTQSEAEVAAVMKSLPENGSVELLYSRAGVIRRSAVRAAEDPRVKVEVKSIEASPLRQRWLRRTE